MKTTPQKEINEGNNSIEKKNSKNDLNNLKLNKLEDDLKNIINEKDEIIKNMNDKLLRQETIIKDQSKKIEQLFQMINDINILNDELKKSIYFDMEISRTDKKMNDLKGIGLDIEIFNENSFDNYFKTENQLNSDTFIFSFNQKKNNKIPIKELSSELASKLGIQFKLKENNERIFIYFYVDKKYLYDLDYDGKNKDINADKKKENEIDDEDNNYNDDIFEIII